MWRSILKAQVAWLLLATLFGCSSDSDTPIENTDGAIVEMNADTGASAGAAQGGDAGRDANHDASVNPASGPDAASHDRPTGAKAPTGGPGPCGCEMNQLCVVRYMQNPQAPECWDAEQECLALTLPGTSGAVCGCLNPCGEYECLDANRSVAVNIADESIRCVLGGS